MTIDLPVLPRRHTKACGHNLCPCFIEGKTIAAVGRATDLVRLGVTLGEIRALLEQGADVGRVAEVLAIIETALRPV